MPGVNKTAEPLDLMLLVRRANDQSVTTDLDLYAALIRCALQTADLHMLLKSADAIDTDLAAAAQKSQAIGPVAQKFYTRSKSIEPSQRFYDLCATQQRLLSADAITACVLLLAALKMLDEIGIKTHYKTVMQDILHNNIHRLAMPLPTTALIGRQRELSDVHRALDTNARGGIIIVGKSGSGKTLLAIAALHRHGTRVYRLFPGNNDFFDHVVNLMVISGDQNLALFLDDIAGFDPGHLAYAAENAKVIATADENAYKKLLQEQPGLAAQFKIIKLQELSEDETKLALTNSATQLSSAYSVSWEDGCIDTAYELAKRYIIDRAFPAKAIELLSEAASIAQKSDNLFITKATIRRLVSDELGLPVSDINDADKKDLSSLPNKLQERIKGQDEAVLKVARVIQRSRLGFGKKNRPIGSFLFVGPSGVGKTELAKAVAHAMFGDEEAMVRLDMSEFAEAHNVQRLIGAPPGYIGYEEGGQLTNPVKAKPYNVVLLDEIEKAHPRVFDLFLQVLDDGRLTDGQGNTVDFRDTLLVATSNAGIEDMLDLIEAGKSTAEIETEVKDILQDYFRIEFINRFDAVILFNSLEPPALEAIARLQLDKLRRELIKRDIHLTVSDASIASIAQSSYDPRYGARGLLRHLQDNVENKLVEMIIAGDLVEGQRIEL